MAITDILTFTVSIFCLARGYSRGFIRSLTGPFSIIVTTVISMFYFQISQDVMASLIIGVVSPVLLNFLLNFLLTVWIKKTDRDVKPSFLSRMGGAFMTSLWAWIFIMLTLILLAVMPSWGDKLAYIHQDVTRSISYLISKPLGNALFGIPSQSATTATEASGADDVKLLAQDPRFQKILQDPEVQDEIKAHDIVKLMNNPKMVNLLQQIMADPAAMKKVLTVYSDQSQPQAFKSP